MSSDIRFRVLLSLQVALLGEIPGALRGVTVGWNDDEVRIIADFDGPISEEDQESMSLVESEVIADLYPERSVVCEVVRLDAPVRLSHLEAWVYLRREPIEPD